MPESVVAFGVISLSISCVVLTSLKSLKTNTFQTVEPLETVSLHCPPTNDAATVASGAVASYVRE